MGLHEWSYSNNYDPSQRAKMRHVDMPRRFQNMTIEVEQGFTPEQTKIEVERCLNCDVQTHSPIRSASSATPHRHLPDRLPDDRRTPTKAICRSG